jgi:hypothetical protein
MYTASYDNRGGLPVDVLFFLAYTAARLPLHFLWASRPLIDPKLFRQAHRPSLLRIVHTHTVPFYPNVQKLFDERFVNYSTNPDAFERACFHRWFALNSATHHVGPEDYVCLLDTDFLIGLSPSKLLELCQREASVADLDFIADWDLIHDDAICPAITIIKKKALHHFCRYLIVHYFDSANQPALLTGYFDRVGNALPGGICDMRALAAWRKKYPVKSFNLRSFKAIQTISNLNEFIATRLPAGLPWQIRFQSDHQALFDGEHVSPLVGTHFQGDAKSYLCLFARRGDKIPVLSSQDVQRHLHDSSHSWRRRLRRLTF